MADTMPLDPYPYVNESGWRMTFGLGRYFLNWKTATPTFEPREGYEQNEEPYYG